MTENAHRYEKVSNSRLELYRENGILSDSLKKLRIELGLKILKAKDDLLEASPIDDRNVGILTHSNWYLSLTEENEIRLIRKIASELQRLELPLTMIESYLEALLYGGEMRDSDITLYYIYFITLLGDSFPANHTTEDKKWLSIHFKNIFKLGRKGRINKDKKDAFQAFKDSVLNKRPEKQVRRLRNMFIKKLALQEKGTIIEPDMELGVKKIKQTDLGIIANAFDDDGDNDTKHAQNLRQHRHREQKRMKKIK